MDGNAETKSRGRLWKDIAATFDRLFASVWVAVVTVFAASCYLAGSSYLRELARSFGFSDSPAEYAFQETVALGFQLLFFPFWIAVSILSIATGSFLVWHGHRMLRQRTKLNVSSIMPYLGLMWASVLLPIMVLIGEVRAENSYNKIVKDLRENCTGCWYYRSKDNVFRGSPLFDDVDRLYIASKSAVVVVKRSELLSISKAAPAQRKRLPLT